MEFPSLRKSIKSHGSYKHTRKISACDVDDSFHEEQPILFEHNQWDQPQHQLDEEDNSSSAAFNVINNEITLMSREAIVGSSPGPHEVIVKIDDNDFDNRKSSDVVKSEGSKVWRDSSYGDLRDVNNKNTYNDNSNIAPSAGVGGSDFSFRNSMAADSSGSLGADGCGIQPPVEQLLEKQNATGLDAPSEISIEMDELRQDNKRPGLPPLPMNRQGIQSQSPSQVPSPVSRTSSGFNEGLSKEIHLSFKETLPVGHSKRRSTAYNELAGSDSNSSNDEDGYGVGDELRPSQQLPQSRRFMNNNDNTVEVVRCTSNALFERVPTLQRTRTNRSRLADPTPSFMSARIPKSGPLRSEPLGKSGMLGKANGGGGGDDDDDDPFLDEDLPEELTKEKINTMIVLEWMSLILLIAALICSLGIPGLRSMRLWELPLWKWEVMVLVLICGRLVSGWGIRIIVFCIERNLMLRKRVLYFVYGLRAAVQNCIWLGLVLLTWHFLFDKRVQREAKGQILPYVTKVLVCFLIGAFIWLIKTLVVKVLASSFHVNAFFDRIQDSLFNQFVIETLSGPPLYEVQRAENESEKPTDDLQRMSQNIGVNVSSDLGPTVPGRNGQATSGNIANSVFKSHRAQSSRHSNAQSSRLSGPISKKHDNAITVDQLHKLNQKNVSAWNMKRLIKIVRLGNLATLDEQIIDDAGNGDESAMQIKSEVEAKVAAKKIFHNVAKPHARYMYFDDLLRFMSHDEADKVMSLFEGASEHERISKSALKNWVVNAFRERRALALTLNDTKTAVNKLRRIVNVIVSIIILVISLIILNLVTSDYLLFCTSQIVLVAFVFGNTCKNVFESIIFLFVVHPFDVGDRCELDGIQMIVEEMNILNTTFLRWDNQKIVYPNFILFSKPIANYYRSPDMLDAVEICFHILTPPEKVALMKQRMISYIENKKEHWYPQPIVVLKDVERLTHLRIAIWLQHRMNHQDMVERWARRALFVEECVKICRELDIDYRMAPVNINIRSMPPTPPISNYSQTLLHQHTGEETVHP